MKITLSKLFNLLLKMRGHALIASFVIFITLSQLTQLSKAEKNNKVNAQSVNISNLLNSFQVGYDRRVRPNYGGLPVTVGTEMEMGCLRKILNLHINPNCACTFWMALITQKKIELLKIFIFHHHIAVNPHQLKFDEILIILTLST